MQKLLFFVMIVGLVACGRPVADFTYSTKEKEAIAPTDISFENRSKNAENYEWDFGDGQKSNDASPSHAYTSSGNFLVKLKAVKGGKTNTSEKRVMVKQPLDCLVEIQTDFGNMVVRLSNATPKHRDNFIKLVEEGFYDGLLFHRVINGFMIQGGDPSSKNATSRQVLGMGGPGYTVPAEFVDSLIHVKGALCAARQGDAVNPEKESSGSQFYIVQGQPLTEEGIEAMENRMGIRYTPEQREAYRTLGGTPQLDRNYTVFGMVIKGLEVIDKIAAVEKGERDRPKEDVKMKMRVIQ